MTKYTIWQKPPKPPEKTYKAIGLDQDGFAVGTSWCTTPEAALNEFNDYPNSFFTCIIEKEL